MYHGDGTNTAAVIRPFTIVIPFSRERVFAALLLAALIIAAPIFRFHDADCVCIVPMLRADYASQYTKLNTSH